MKDNNKTKNNVPQVFDFDNHQIRTTVDKNNNPFFVAKDVCEVLEINNPRQAVKNIESRLKEADLKGVISNDTLLKTTGGKQTLITINEQGLYELIFASRKKKPLSLERGLPVKSYPPFAKQAPTPTNNPNNWAEPKQTPPEKPSTSLLKTMNLNTPLKVKALTAVAL
jgi:hypothetical protein